MIRSLILFAHIAGMLALFIGLGLELVALQHLRRANTRDEASPWLRLFGATPRIYGTAFALILLSGIFLAARVGVHASAFVRVSFLAMVLMAIIGGPLLRSRKRALAQADDSRTFRQHAANPLLRASIHIRVALGLAIVYLMIAKVPIAESLTAMGIALLVGGMTSVFDARRPAEPTTGSVY